MLGVHQDANNKTIFHEWAAGPSQANDVFYSVQAAQAAFPDLSKEFVVIGHSQGGGAAWEVAQRQVNEPVNGYLGAIAVSPITSVLKQTGPEAPAIAAAITPSVAAFLPTFNTSDVTTPQGQAALDQMFAFGGCIAMVDAIFVPGVPLVQDGWQENVFLQEWQALVINGGREVSGPLL